LAIDLKKTDEIVFCAFIDLAAAMARISERSQADARQMTGPLGRDVTKQMRNDALRKVIRLYAIGDSEALQFRHKAPVAADHASHQSFMTEMVESAFLAVALSCGVNQSEIARLAGCLDLLIFRQIERLQRHRDFLCETNTHEAAGRDCVALANEACRLL